MSSSAATPQDDGLALARLNASHAFLSKSVVGELILETYLRAKLMLRAEGFEVAEPGRLDAEWDSRVRRFYQLGRVTDPTTGCQWELTSFVWICQEWADFGEMGLAVSLVEVPPVMTANKLCAVRSLFALPPVPKTLETPAKLLPALEVRLREELKGLTPYSYLQPTQLASAQARTELQQLVRDISSSLLR